MRLTSDFFVSAYLRQVQIEGAFGALRRRGSPEAGAIFILIDRLDGTASLYGPASQASYEASGDARAFTLLASCDARPHDAIEKRLEREIRFDPDCWIIEVESRSGQHFLDRVV